MKYYILAIQNYLNIKGRARRSEYWFFALFNFIFLILSTIIDSIIGTSFMEFGFGYISLVYYLWALIPAFTVAVRRMHDTGSSGWYLLMGLIPLVGGIILLVKLFTDSQFGPNQYGENPKPNPYNFQL